MAVSGPLRRHRVAIAANLVLLVAAVGVVVVATQSDGYRKHDAQLNDGGIWVTNGHDGFHGRINKPIAQLDGVAFADQDQQLDVVQDGAAVLAVNYSAGVATPIDPGKVELPQGDDVALPSAPQIGLAGGSAAVLDPATGALWAERVDTRLGIQGAGELDADSDPLAATAADASLAVTLAGEVLVATTSDGKLRRFAAAGSGFAAPATTDLGADLGPGTFVSAVGDRAVALDTETGALQVVGGSDADVAPSSELQQPGPASGAVLVGSADALLSLDLDTGEETEVVGADDGVAGRPAAPVRLGACVYGAWASDTSMVATVCDGAEPRVSRLGTKTTDLVFRVNRGEIVLNDRTSGAVWDVDADNPTRLDNWDAFQRKPDRSDEDDDNENVDQGDRRPPQAEDDDLGARPGRTTVLHPLDNDTAPAGRLLAIVDVKPSTTSDADVTISPDGQTVQIEMPDQARATSFDYTINDGRSGISASATVRVSVRSDDVNADPQFREGFEKRTWYVPAGGTLDVPVLPDWRDKQDGDPLALDSAVAAGGDRSGAVARTTSAGRVRFTAPAEPGEVEVQYAVTDGIGEPVSSTLDVVVQDLKERKAYAGVAEPDVVAGEVGKTVTIRPLANDLPGSDPVNPTAVAQLAGKVAQVGNADVRTDLVDGTVSFTAEKPATYFLDYDLRYGNAPFDAGRVRIDVKAPDNPPPAPIAMPDSLTLYGQAATLVDVVANDIDPTGGILVVQGATPARADTLDVAVVQGRWLRIAAREGELVPNPQLVRYTISNGDRSGVTGEVVVSWRPSPADNTPVTEVDRAVVREGGAVSVPVLDNDFSPAGDELDLVADVPGEQTGAGALVVRRPGDDRKGVLPTGQAFVTDRFVRYVAPEGLDEVETFTVPYLATNRAGDRAPGLLEVEVVPAERRNLPPEPPTLEGRLVAGDTIKLRLPGVGVDPDGDPVTLTGIAGAPTLGRVLRYGATSLVYQAYPDSAGTDEFSYTVVDSLGATATGSVRVAVAAPGSPQPPLAVPDTVTTEPGRTARFDVLANDFVAAGDRASITLLDQRAGVRLETPQGPLLVDAPARVTDDNVEVVYKITNGLDSSQSTATLRLADTFNNPPVVFDAYGTPADAGAASGDGADLDGTGNASSVTVDVLETAYDPDGETAALTVEALAPAGVVATVAGGRVTVERGPQPRVVPFRVVDADGGSATASIYVPPLSGGAPYVVPGALVEVDPGTTADLDLTDYIVDPSGGDVMFTLKDSMSGSPTAGVKPEITGERAFSVTASDQYAGPAAVVFEVTTGDAVDDPAGVKATLTVPVQVGAAEPILRCPSDPVRIVQARTIELDVASFCHVWTPDLGDAADVTFDADWDTSADGLAIIRSEGRVVSVNADGAAVPGTRVRLKLTAGGSEPGFVDFVVVEAPPPTLVPIALDDMEAGQQRTIDLAPYLRPGVVDPEPTVVSVDKLTGPDVTATPDGSSLRLRTGADVSGRAQFRVVMSDVAGSSGPERQARQTVTIDVRARPDRPPAPVPGTAARDQEVRLSWRAPAANGAPIDRYQVRGNGGAGRECGGTACEVGGLTNGRDYRFEVRAHNAVGWSDWSPSSARATPDARPGRVGPIQMVEEGDGFLRLRWTPPTTDTSAIKQYVVSWDDGGSEVTRTTEVVAPRLDNNRAYKFTVYAVNKSFRGETRTSASFQSVGTPFTPDQPSLSEQPTSSDETAIRVSWPRVNGNGPVPIRYTVLRDGAPLPGCTGITANECTNTGIQYDGRTYTYAVQATNKDGRGKTSAVGPAEFYRAVGDPEPWGDWSLTPTGANNTGSITYTIPDTNGARSHVRIIRDGGTVVRELDGTGPRTETVPNPDNDGAHSFVLEACNEETCSTSSTKTLQTYGPLGRQHVVDMTPTTSGRNVRWSITVDANGDAATLTVRSSQRGTVSYPVNSVGTVTIAVPSLDIGFSNTETLTATISDGSPNRGSGERQTTSPRTDDPPDPTLVISKGERCGPAGSADPCNKNGGPNCVDTSCARIRFATTDWPSSPMYCDFYDSATTGAYDTARAIATNRTIAPGPYFGYPDRSVWAICVDSGGGNRTESNHLNWN